MTSPCTVDSAGIPTTFASQVQVIGYEEPGGNTVPGLNFDVTSNGVNIFDGATVEDGTTFTWRAETDTDTTSPFVGPIMTGTVNCALGTFNFDLGFCEVTLSGIPEDPNNGGQVDIADGSTIRYQDIGPDDPVIILPTMDGYEYRALTDVGSPFTGNFVEFDTFNCGDTNGPYEKTVDVSGQFCEVTFTNIPPARPGTPSCGGQLRVQSGSIGNGYQEIKDGVRDTVLLPSNIISYEYVPETDIDRGVFNGPNVQFDTSDCESGSKSIDVSSSYCVVRIVDVPENPNCGGQIRIVNGSPNNGYQQLREGNEILLPNNQIGTQYIIETDVNNGVFSSNTRGIFDTVGCDGGEIELSVSADFCEVTLKGVPSDLLLPDRPNDRADIRIANGSTNNQYQELTNCDTILFPRNTCGLTYIARSFVADGQYPGPAIYLDTFNCDNGMKELDTSVGFCLVTFCGIPSSPNGGGQITIIGSRDNNDERLSNWFNGDIALLPRNENFEYRPETDIDMGDGTNTFNGNDIRFDTTSCSSGSITVDASIGFCLVKICGIPNGNGAAVILPSGSTENGYRPLLNGNTVLLPNGFSFGLRVGTDIPTPLSSSFSFEGPPIISNTAGCNGGSLFVDTTDSFCLVTIVCCDDDCTGTQIDIYRFGSSKGSIANGYQELDIGDTFWFPTNVAAEYAVVVVGDETRFKFDTFGCDETNRRVDLDITEAVDMAATPCTPSNLGAPPVDASCLASIPTLPPLSCPEEQLSDYIDDTCTPTDVEPGSCGTRTEPQCLTFTEFPSFSSEPSDSSSPSITPTTSTAPSGSREPSDVPSLSLQPSSSPSDEPSMAPSSSLHPSADPSGSPTTSLEPSDSSSPSEAPSTSSEPSEEPSISPSTSQIPSSTPSLSQDPSTAPSETPSVSTEPSVELCPSTCVIEDAPSVSLMPSLSDFPSLSLQPSSDPSMQPTDSFKPSISDGPTTSLIPSMKPSTSLEPSISDQPSASEEPSAFCPETCFDGIPTECLEPPTCSTSSSSSKGKGKGKGRSSTGRSSSSSESSTGSSSSSSSKGEGKGKGKSKIKSSSCSDDRDREYDLPEVEESPNTRGGITAASENISSQPNDNRPESMMIAIVAAIVAALNM